SDLGVEFDSEEALNDAFARFKVLADKKHEIYDEDLQALVSQSFQEAEEFYKLVSMKVSLETGEKPLASLTLNIEGEEKTVESGGSGPVDAAFKAIERAVDSDSVLQLYSVNNITSGTDSQGEVTVRVERKGLIVNGQGADTDIVVASVKAYLNALNKLKAPERRAHPQHASV
ncbi:MAG TPA: 2-isopropylmalate synthase, partial [Gammaproteobacteria bacterium]|nr:2-isopropylmalate synthase [Gammaproteobacteria bacterium]